MKLIKRKDYLNKVIDVIGTPDIKVITDSHAMNFTRIISWHNKNIPYSYLRQCTALLF